MTQPFRLRVTRRANADINRAAVWWDQNRPLVPDALREELDRAFSLLVVQPQIGEPALNVQAKSVRRLHLARVHYHIYYRVRGDEVQVLALWYASRGTGPGI